MTLQEVLEGTFKGEEKFIKSILKELFDDGLPKNKEDIMGAIDGNTHIQKLIENRSVEVVETTMRLIKQELDE